MRDYDKVYDQKALEQDVEANQGRPFHHCNMSVMVTFSDPNIKFDVYCFCNYY
jgi:hypothetical protein